MIGCRIQTRTGSSRLPGKIMMSVNKNIPIDTILSWGPKKFFSGINESFVDLSELLSLQTLLELNSKIQEKYLPGALFTIFIEDFEGKFIEGEKLNSVFDNYITSFENLVKIVGLNNIIKIVRTDDLLKTNFEASQIFAKSTPVLIPIPLSINKTSSVATLPLAPGAYGQPPNPPTDVSITSISNSRLANIFAKA